MHALRMYERDGNRLADGGADTERERINSRAVRRHRIGRVLNMHMYLE